MPIRVTLAEKKKKNTAGERAEEELLGCKLRREEVLRPLREIPFSTRRAITSTQ